MTRRALTIAERIHRNIEIDRAGCWLWTGSLTWDGYPRIGIRPAGVRQAKVYRAHRISYETFVRPIPAGLTLDHKCRVRRCVNPAHLEPASHWLNIHRSPFTAASINSAKTHCPRGHQYDELNTYVNRGKRYCRACQSGRRPSAILAASERGAA